MSWMVGGKSADLPCRAVRLRGRGTLPRGGEGFSSAVARNLDLEGVDDWLKWVECVFWG